MLPRSRKGSLKTARTFAQRDIPRKSPPLGNGSPVLQSRIGFAQVRHPALQSFPADGAALLELHDLLLGNKSRDRFEEAALKIQPAILAVGQNRQAVRFLFRNKRFDGVVLSLRQFVIADFAVAMARVSVFECSRAEQTPDLIDTGEFSNGRQR